MGEGRDFSGGTEIETPGWWETAHAGVRYGTTASRLPHTDNVVPDHSMPGSLARC